MKNGKKGVSDKALELFKELNETFSNDETEAIAILIAFYSNQALQTEYDMRENK